MSRARRFALPADPLLAVGKAVTLIVQGLMLLAALAVAIAFPIILFFNETITSELRAEMADPGFVFPTGTVLLVVALAFAIVLLVFAFLRYLARIIDTVGEGDPFVPDNAKRLTAMAWLMLAVQLLTLALAFVGIRAASIFEGAEAEIGAMDVDFSGIILVITLFILARVFRKGAEMRADLEGTV